MRTVRQGSRICIDVPGKLNLFLELRGRRPDGYHELDMLMVPVSLYDRLVISPRADDVIHLDCRWRDVHSDEPLPEPADNLVSRAVATMRSYLGERYSRDQAETRLAGLNIQVFKQIPAAAGMGGASADAAAAMVGANAIWQSGLSRHELAELGGKLGSDIPFFFYQTPAICLGRGERVMPISGGLPTTVVIVKPPVGLSTAAVYREASVPQVIQTSTSIRDAFMQGHLAKIGERMFNRLQEAATRLTPWIERLQKVLYQLDTCGHQMSGSGTSYFALCRNRAHGHRLAACLRARRLGQVFVASFLPASCRDAYSFVHL